MKTSIYLQKLYCQDATDLGSSIKRVTGCATEEAIVNKSISCFLNECFQVKVIS